MIFLKVGLPYTMYVTATVIVQLIQDFTKVYKSKPSNCEALMTQYDLTYSLDVLDSFN